VTIYHYLLLTLCSFHENILLPFSALYRLAAESRLYVLLLFLIFKNCSCLTNYPKIYQSDLCQIVKLGRTVAVDDQSEISFSIPRGTLQWQPSFAGAARWSDIGLCPAFSSKWFAEAQPAVGKVR